MTVVVKKVTVNIAKYQVELDPIRLFQPAKDEAEWRTDFPVRIEFDPSPFECGNILKSLDGVIRSGPIKEDASGEYKYSIFWEDGHELDPRVIIDR